MSDSDNFKGTILSNRYRIDSKIAKGGMATVYKGTDIKLDRPVAIKIMHSHLTDDERFLERFEREAKSAAKLSDSGIVSIFDQGKTDDGSYYIVMENVDGITLRKILSENGASPLNNAIDLMIQISGALSTAHKSGFVHRDIKPENIIITPDGKAKITDFGLTRKDNDKTIASSGVVMGTVAYLAPELVSDGQSTKQTDVYALGVLFYELITGKQPFKGEKSITVAYKHVHENFPHINTNDFPQSVDDLIQQLTSKDLSFRPKDSGSVLKLFKDLKNGKYKPDATDDATEAIAINNMDNKTQVLNTATQSGHKSNLPKPRTKKPKLKIFLILLLVLALAGGGYFLYFSLNKVSVPNVVGMTVDEAKSLILSKKLNPKVVQTYSDTVQNGIIAEQNPVPTEKAEKNSDINIFVSMGIKYINMPNFQKMTYDDYVASLTDMGYDGTIEKSLDYDTNVKKDQIISVSPKVGKQIKHSDVIQIVVSKGPEPIEMPDLVGKPLSEVEEILNKLDMKVSISSYELSDTYAKNQVISQSIQAGTKTHKGKSVSLVVSKGPKMVMLPSVVGKSFSTAQKQLTALGFKVVKKIIGSGALGLVQSMSPSPGQKIKNGSTVTLNVV